MQNPKALLQARTKREISHRPTVWKHRVCSLRPRCCQLCLYQDPQWSVHSRSADTKEERISRALTGGLPIIAGIGASMAFTAMLFSGIKGMLYGAATSVGLSKLGSIADKCINGKTTQKQDPAINNSTSTSQQKGAIYA